MRCGAVMTDTDRDLRGYGRRRPFADWPGGARVAVSFVLNYEEGGERSVADGDAQAENYLVPEIVGLPADRRPQPQSSRTCSNTAAAPDSGGSCACSKSGGCISLPGPSAWR